MTRLREARKTFQMGHPGGQAALVARRDRHPRLFPAPVDDALRVDAPGEHFGLWKTHLRERNPHLDDPPAVVAAHRRFPHRVPRVVLIDVVVDDGVFLHAGRGHAKLDAGQMVVVGVEEDREPVGIGDDVAAGQPADDARRIAVVQPGGDIDRVVVIGQPQFRLLARRLSLVRQPLDEAGDHARLLPGEVVEPAVDADGARRAAGVEGRTILGGEYGHPEQTTHNH